MNFVGALRSAICFWVGRVGRARRVGLLIFKKQMPSGFAHGRYLGHLMENCFAQSTPGRFHETIVLRVLRVPHVLLCDCMAQSTEMVVPGIVGCGTSKDSVVKDQFGSFLCHFASAKHIFKASGACNGREVLHGTPERRHGISAIEAADCLGNREPTIHWKVSRTSAACRVGSRKHLSPSAMRSEPVGRTPGAEVSLRLAGITCPLG